MVRNTSFFLNYGLGANTNVCYYACDGNMNVCHYVCGQKHQVCHYVCVETLTFVIVCVVETSRLKVFRFFSFRSERRSRWPR